MESAMKLDRLCAACSAFFTPLVHVPNQRYCSLAACQLARRRLGSVSAFEPIPITGPTRRRLRPRGAPVIPTIRAAIDKRIPHAVIAIARCSERATPGEMTGRVQLTQR